MFVQPGRGRECQEGDVAVAYSKNGQFEDMCSPLVPVSAGQLTLNPPFSCTPPGLRHKDLVEQVRQTSRENGLTPFDRGLLSLPLCVGPLIVSSSECADAKSSLPESLVHFSHELATLILCLAAISSSSCLSTGRGGGATWIASRDGGRVERVGPHGVRQSSKESKL